LIHAEAPKGGCGFLKKPVGRPTNYPHPIPTSQLPKVSIAVFLILADVVEVKTGSRSTAHSSSDFIRLNRWLRNCFAQLITPLDIDGIGQNCEDSNMARDSKLLLARDGRRGALQTGASPICQHTRPRRVC